MLTSCSYPESLQKLCCSVWTSWKQWLIWSACDLFISKPTLTEQVVLLNTPLESPHNSSDVTQTLMFNTFFNKASYQFIGVTDDYRLHWYSWDECSCKDTRLHGQVRFQFTASATTLCLCGIIKLKISGKALNNHHSMQTHTERP